MTLEALLERINPNKYIREISRRQDLSWDIIQKYPALPWPHDCLSYLAPLSYITLDLSKSWNYTEISEREDLTIDFIKLHKDKLKWDYISMNVDFQDVIENPALPWIWRYLSFNKTINPDYIIENPDLPWDYKSLSEHIDLDFVYANPELMWEYRELSSRVCLDFINENIDQEWDYYMISQNPNLTIEFILEHSNKPWDWWEIYANSNITLEDVLTNNLQYKSYESFQYRYPDYCIENLSNLNWEIISEYASLDIIKKYPALPWKYSKLSINPNINIDFVLEHPALSWNYSELSSNPGISLQDVLYNWDLPWNIISIVAYKY